MFNFSLDKTKNPDFRPVGMSLKRLKVELTQKHIRTITTGRKTAEHIGGNRKIAPVKLESPARIHDVVLMRLHSGCIVLLMDDYVKEKEEWDKYDQVGKHLYRIQERGICIVISLKETSIKPYKQQQNILDF